MTTDQAHQDLTEAQQALWDINDALNDESLTNDQVVEVIVKVMEGYER